MQNKKEQEGFWELGFENAEFKCIQLKELEKSNLKNVRLDDPAMLFEKALFGSGKKPKEYVYSLGKINKERSSIEVPYEKTWQEFLNRFLRKGIITIILVPIISFFLLSFLPISLLRSVGSLVVFFVVANGLYYLFSSPQKIIFLNGEVTMKGIFYKPINREGFDEIRKIEKQNIDAYFFLRKGCIVKKSFFLVAEGENRKDLSEFISSYSRLLSDVSLTE